MCASFSPRSASIPFLLVAVVKERVHKITLADVTVTEEVTAMDES
jgi:hypothetical protein